MSIRCCPPQTVQKAKVNSKVSKTKVYKEVELLSRRASPKAAVDLSNGIQTFKKNIRLDDIIESIDDPGKILSKIPFGSLNKEISPFQSAMKDAMVQAAMISVVSLPAPRDKRLRFDVQNPRIDRYIQSRTGNLIQNITDDAHKVVRMAVYNSFTSAKTPRQVAQEIKDSIGLHDRYAKALVNYKSNLTTSGMAPNQVERMGDKYELKLLDARSMTVARTEIRNAVNNGQLAVWQQAANNGLYAKQTARKVWVTDGDPCPICEPMDGESVPLDGVWSLDDGTMCDVPSDAHPNCYCGMELEFDESESDQEDLDYEEE